MRLGVFPNPAAGDVSIGLTLPTRTGLSLQIYDVAGRLVNRLAAGLQAAGRRQRIWNGQDEAGHRLAAGLHLCRLRAGSFESTERVVPLR